MVSEAPTVQYDPELTMRQMREALLAHDANFRKINDIMVEAAAKAESEHFTDPRAREQAGLGAVIAGANIAGWAKPGGEAAMVNSMVMFGLALVDSARDELRREASS